MADREDEYAYDEEVSEGGSASLHGPDSDEEGEDLMDNYEQDYRPMEHLDYYEEDGLDASFMDDATMEARMDARAAAEAAMAQRDRREGRMTGQRRGLPAALLAEDESEVEAEARPRRRRRVEEAQAGEDVLGDYEINLEESRGPLKEWVAKEEVRAEVKRQFARFLRTFSRDGKEAVYPPIMRAMVRTNCQSLELDYVDLANGLPVVAVWVADLPRDVLPILNETAKEMVMEEFAEFGEAQPEIFVRLANIPLEESIRDLRHFHLNQLVRVDGVVTRRTGIYPQLQQIRYDCGACGAVLGPFVQTGEREVRPLACPSCEARGPFTINARETVYRNYQKVTLQEPPGSVPAGRLPRSKDVILLADLVDGVRPGEEVVVTGIFQHSYEAGANARHGFPVYGTSIEAVHLARRGERYSGARLTDEDRAEIRALARDPRIARRIVKSIAPSIYGHESVKLGVALALFGGQEKHPGGTGSHRLRGDINVLLLGDPGTAKSQFLKYLERVAHRAVYTTGKGASAVGLTASVHKDAITGEWTLEGGALVLADRGVCLIDEFDKMNDADRVSIHEAMEQQSISISKAGIVTQLQARCSVVAAANPVGGRYDASKTFRENVELTDPILSRFDVLCVIRDTVDAVNDARLASFVVASHAKSHPDHNVGEEGGDVVAVAGGPDTTTTTTPPLNQPDDLAPLSQEMLRKYVTYAKQAVRPRLQAADHDKIAQVYAELRREAALTQGMPIAVRHLESMVRMAEARAAMHLRDAVSSDDIDAAIRVMLESFIGTQKLSVQKVLRRKFRRFVVDHADFDALALFKLRECLREARRAESVTGARADERNFSVPVRQLEERCRDLDIVDLQPFFRSATFQNAGFSLSTDGSQVLLPRA